MSQLSTPIISTLQSRAHRSLSSHMNQTLRRYNISLTGWTLLGIVANARHVRPSIIAEQLGMKRSLITTIIREYEKRDFIKSTTDPQDTRAKIVSLTTHGVHFTTMLDDKLRTDLHGFLMDVSVEDLTTYLRVLRTLANKPNNQNI